MPRPPDKVSFFCFAAPRGNTITTASAYSTSPILIQNLSSGTTYSCYILTYFDGSLKSTSGALSVTTTSTSIFSSALIWLDANYSSSITTSGGYVTKWADRSGNGYDAIPASTAAASYSSTTMDSTYPGLLLGNTMYCSTFFASSGFAGGNVTIFAVLKVTSSSGFLYTKTWDSATQYFSFHFYGNERWFCTTRITPYSNYSMSGMSSRQIFCFRMSYSGYSYKEYQNGSLIYSSTMTSYNLPPPSTHNLNFGYSGGSSVYSEIIVFNSALSVSNMDTITSYLGSKWGVTVSTVTS